MYDLCQDPNMLTLISMTGLVLTLLDYIVPRIMASLFPEASWTAEKEKRFDQICNEMVRPFH